MRIPPATCKYTQLSRHVRIHDSGRGRGNLIRVFTPSKACLSPWDRGAHKSSSSVSPCAASDVQALFVHVCSYHSAVLCMHRFVHVCCHMTSSSPVASHIPPDRYPERIELRSFRYSCICFESICPCASHVVECIKPVLF